MTAFACSHHIARIGRLPSAQWRAEVDQLPADCGRDDCTTRNCQREVQSRLEMQWKIRRSKRKAA